jgi:hypothetical protein
MKIIVSVAVLGAALLAAALFYTHTHGRDNSSAYMPRHGQPVIINTSGAVTIPEMTEAETTSEMTEAEAFRRCWNDRGLWQSNKLAYATIRYGEVVDIYPWYRREGIPLMQPFMDDCANGTMGRMDLAPAGWDTP